MTCLACAVLIALTCGVHKTDAAVLNNNLLPQFSEWAQKLHSDLVSDIVNDKGLGHSIFQVTSVDLIIQICSYVHAS